MMVDNKKESKKKTKSDIPSVSDPIDGELITNLQNRILWIKIGNDDKPAGNAEIEEMTGKVEALFEINKVNCMVLVTHHAMDVKIV